MKNKKKTEKEEGIKGLCLLCKKGPSKKDFVVREDKDFVCSICTQYLLEHPRRSGESIEEVYADIMSKRECDNEAKGCA